MVEQLATIVQSGPPTAAPLSVADLCATALAWVQPRLAADNVRVVALIPPDLPPAIADRGVLLRTLLTLLDLTRRASRATDKGRTITLQAERHPANALPGGRSRAVRLTVQAEGPEQATRSFSSFPFASEVNDDGLQWLGAQSAVAGQGGLLWAESRPEGGGTDFILDLPAG